MPKRQRKFAVYDVFSSQRLAGNPLAVVFEPDGLDDDAMQAIAGEFNLSETVFILPPSNKAHRANVRIFTPMHELPFAGHPTVGAAIAITEAAGGDDAVDLRAGGKGRAGALRRLERPGRHVRRIRPAATAGAGGILRRSGSGGRIARPRSRTRSASKTTSCQPIPAACPTSSCRSPGLPRRPKPISTRAPGWR